MFYHTPTHNICNTYYVPLSLATHSIRLVYANTVYWIHTVEMNSIINTDSEGMIVGGTGEILRIFNHENVNLLNLHSKSGKLWLTKLKKIKSEVGYYDFNFWLVWPIISNNGKITNGKTNLEAVPEMYYFWYYWGL